MSRWPLLLLVLLASALGLAACGDDDDGGGDPTEVLAQTFGGGKEVESGRLDASLRINAKGIPQLNQPVTLALRGPFQSSGGEALPKFAFEIDVNSNGQAFKAGAVNTGKQGFLNFMGQAYVLPAELYKTFTDGYAETAKCNRERDGDKSNATFRALGIDPRRWLTKPTDEGKEDVGGVETIHIASGIDVPKMLEDVNRILGRTDLERDPCADKDKAAAEPKQGTRQLSAQQRKTIAEAVKSARVDIWTGADDKILRRLNVDLKIESKDRKQTGDVRLDLTIGALNEEQTVKAPGNTKPLEELLARLNGGQAPELPGGSGSGSGSGSGGTPAPAPAPEGSSPYAQCVAEAGNDVQKLQQCLDTQQ